VLRRHRLYPRGMAPHFLKPFRFRTAWNRLDPIPLLSCRRHSFIEFVAEESSRNYGPGGAKPADGRRLSYPFSPFPPFLQIPCVMVTSSWLTRRFRSGAGNPRVQSLDTRAAVLADCVALD
jgi:hypothetical protein